MSFGRSYQQSRLEVRERLKANSIAIAEILAEAWLDLGEISASVPGRKPNRHRVPPNAQEPRPRLGVAGQPTFREPKYISRHSSGNSRRSRHSLVPAPCRQQHAAEVAAQRESRFARMRTALPEGQVRSRHFLQGISWPLRQDESSSDVCHRPLTLLRFSLTHLLRQMSMGKLAVLPVPKLREL